MKTGNPSFSSATYISDLVRCGPYLRYLAFEKLRFLKSGRQHARQTTLLGPPQMIYGRTDQTQRAQRRRAARSSAWAVANFAQRQGNSTILPLGRVWGLRMGCVCCMLHVVCFQVHANLACGLCIIICSGKRACGHAASQNFASRSDSMPHTHAPTTHHEACFLHGS